MDFMAGGELFFWLKRDDNFTEVCYYFFRLSFPPNSHFSLAPSHWHMYTIRWLAARAGETRSGCMGLGPRSTVRGRADLCAGGAARARRRVPVRDRARVRACGMLASERTACCITVLFE